MPLSPQVPYDIPDYWVVFGHSWMQYAFGTYYQTGRADALFFATMDTEPFNKRNWAVNGSRACIEGASTGGFARFFKGSKKPQRGGPYVADGGAAMFCYGINDLGLVGFTTQVKTAYQHAMRSMITRWRMAVIYENDFLVGTRTSYGAGFGSIGAAGYTSNDNTLDAGGAVMLDFWGLEAQNPSPIIVCNTARLTAAGYTGNYASWTGTEASRDQDVVDLNANLTAVVAEFDSMVQIADVDSVINKQAAFLFSDGLHPNEFGAAAVVDAIADARKRLRPTNAYKTRNFNVPAPRASAVRKPRQSGKWYTAENTPPAAATTAAALVAGEVWAIPVIVTEATEFWNRLVVEQTNSPVTGSTIRWGIYDDVGWSGYPQEIVSEPTAASGALSLGSVPATILSPTGGNGSFQTVMDPGLYWISLMTVTIGSGSVLRSIQGPNGVMPNTTSTGALGAMTLATMPNAWRVTGVATTAMPTSWPSGGVATANAPYVGFQVNINLTN
jgi:hypothetical protein